MTGFTSIKDLFKNCTSPQEKYQKIIELGKQLPAFPEEKKISENIIQGCQSIVYFDSKLQNGKLFFSAYSDALISSGLAYLLITAYNDHSPEFILKTPPTFLQQLQINTSLTPGRSNGLASMFLRMQQDALKYFALTTQ